MRKPLPNALDIDLAGGLTQEVTPHASLALLIELGRRSGVMALAAMSAFQRCGLPALIRRVFMPAIRSLPLASLRFRLWSWGA